MYNAEIILLNRIKIRHFLLLIALVLICASVLGQLTRFLTAHPSAHGLIPLFNLDAERNFPTFFSSLIMVAASALLAIITYLQPKKLSYFKFCWATLAFGFMLMAADEFIGFHEQLSGITKREFGLGGSGFLHFAWVIPAIIIISILGMFFLKFLIRLDSNTRTGFLLAGGVFLSGAIGMEMVDGRYYDLHGDTLLYNLMSTIEESLEFFGVILFIDRLLLYIATHHKYTSINFQSKTEYLNTVLHNIPRSANDKIEFPATIK